MLTVEQKIARKQYVTASNGACLFDAHPFRSKFEWWAELVGDITEPDDFGDGEQVHPMEMGNHLQSGVGSLYQAKRRRTGDQVVVMENIAQKLSTNPKYPRLAATIDFDQLLNGEAGIAETKVAHGRPYNDRHGNRIVPLEEWRNGVPLAYQVQGQIQMMVTGLAFVTFPVLILSDGVLLWHDMEPNEKFQAEVAERAEEFFDKHVLTGIPPVPTDYAKAVKLLPRLVPERQGTVCLEGDDAAYLDREYRRVAMAKREAEAKVRQYDEELAKLKYSLSEAMGDAAEAVIDATGNTYKLKNIRVAEKAITRKAYEFLRVDLKTPKTEEVSE